jgi:hypothetical protein
MYISVVSRLHSYQADHHQRIPGRTMPRSAERGALLLALGALLLATACEPCGCAPCVDDAGTDGGVEPGCEPFVVGTIDAGIEMEIVLRTAGGQQVDAVEGGDVELFRPPQGGKVFLVGARVKNVDTCGLRVTGVLRDPCTGNPLGVESRPFRTAVTDAGWAEPVNPRSLSNYSNVPTCPRSQATRNLYDEPYDIEVVIEDTANGRSATRSLRMFPRCVQGGALGNQCRCECNEDYVLGDECPLIPSPDDGGVPPSDGGVPDGGIPVDCPDD